jgi:hypothetical protein
MDVGTSPIISCSLYCANTIGAAIRAPLRGEAQRIKKISEINLLGLQMRITSPKGAESAHRFAYKRRAQRSAIQYYWRYVARTTLPIFPELAYNLGSTDRKRKYGKTKMKSK